MSTRHAVSFCPPVALAGIGWAEAGQPAALAGLGICVALAVALWPLAVIAVVFFLPACVKAMVVPRRLRIWYRQHREKGWFPWRHTHGRPGIPRFIRRVVYAMDRYRCVFCGSGEKIQVDHIRPWRAGGPHSLWNFAVLCEVCNLVKSNYYDKGGFDMYRAWDNYNDRRKAAAIIANERRRRWNPLRWLRAAWSLG